MSSRVRPLALALGGLVLLLIGALWWAFSGTDGPAADPLVPQGGSESHSSRDPEPTLVLPERGDAVDPRFGVPIAEPEPARANLVVRVVDSIGHIIPTANVGITSPLGETTFSMRRSDEQHRFTDLALGTWTVMTYAVSYVDLELTIELDATHDPIELEVQLPDALLLPVRFLTPAGENAVDVLNSMENSPLSGLDLYAVATNALPDSTLPRMAPGARPQYGAGLFHHLSAIVPGQSPIPHPGAGYAGVLELKQAPPLFVSSVLRETVLETFEIGASGAREITFTIHPDQLIANLASAKVTVLDAETHEPVERIEVTCDDANINGSARDGSAADAQGHYTFTQRFPGWANVRAYAPDYEVFQTAVKLEAGALHDLGTIYLEKSVSLTGRVENQAGEGVRSIFFARDKSWSATGGPPEFGHTLGSSGRDGKMMLNQLGPRVYQVYVIARGYAPQAVELDLTGSQPEPLEIVMQPGTKAILAARYDADLTHRVSIYDNAGVLCFSEFIPGKRTRDTWLAPGEYSLVMHHGPREVARRTIEITEESAVHALTQ